MVNKNTGNGDAGSVHQLLSVGAWIEQKGREYGFQTGVDCEPAMPHFATCSEHGEYPLFELDAHGINRWNPEGCPTCRTQQRVERLMSRAAIPKRHAGCTFENYIVESKGQAHALDISRRFAAQFADHMKSGTSLLFIGTKGTGKNHLSAAIAKTILQQGFSVLHATAFEVTAKIKATWSKAGDEPRRHQLDVIDDFASVNLLILDEIGCGIANSTDSTLLFHIIDQRYQRCHPTLAISNFSLDVVEQWLTPPGLDRLREGGGDCVKLEWESDRGHGAG